MARIHNQTVVFEILARYEFSAGDVDGTRVCYLVTYIAAWLSITQIRQKMATRIIHNARVSAIQVGCY